MQKYTNEHLIVLYSYILILYTSSELYHAAKQNTRYTYLFLSYLELYSCVY